jgi:predicted nuclease with RNAse H fold
MLIAGLDLAAEPKATALSLIDWSGKSARLVQLDLNIDDRFIVDSTRDALKLGIDCALGWPIEFVEFLNRYSQNSFSQIDGDMSWRRRMAYRETDRAVRELTGRWPLSVSTGRLGLTAMRCAGLLSKLAADGVEIDRTGAGKVVEIYPGASLRLWAFDTSGYRASAASRAALLEQICEAAPWFEPGEFAELMIDSCDSVDSVIANFAARSAQMGLSTRPAREFEGQARKEGWIALPETTMAALLQKQTIA